MMICVNDEPFIDDSISGFIDEENDVEFTGWPTDAFITLTEEVFTSDPSTPLHAADQFGRTLEVRDVKVHGPIRNGFTKTWSYFPMDHASVKVSMRCLILCSILCSISDTDTLFLAFLMYSRVWKTN